LICPEVGLIEPEIKFNKVVLPAPFSQKRPTHSRRWALNEK
jgi:hypothetical protein